jgi:hypothetical protein
MSAFDHRAASDGPGDMTMRGGKLVLAAVRGEPAAWSAEQGSRPAWHLPRLRLPRLFARKESTLFQRCLAVHIYHASRSSSLR